MDNPTTREIYLLLTELKKQYDNHLKHHFAITITCIATISTNYLQWKLFDNLL
jgi:hypothetical protein